VCGGDRLCSLLPNHFGRLFSFVFLKISLFDGEKGDQKKMYAARSTSFNVNTKENLMKQLSKFECCYGVDNFAQ